MLFARYRSANGRCFAIWGTKVKTQVLRFHPRSHENKKPKEGRSPDARRLYFRKGNPRPKPPTKPSREAEIDARLGAPRNGGAGVVTYVKPSIAGATTYCGIYARESSQSRN